MLTRPAPDGALACLTTSLGPAAECGVEDGDIGGRGSLLRAVDGGRPVGPSSGYGNRAAGESDAHLDNARARIVAFYEENGRG